MKKNKGITLVTLVVTIVVLIILATISVNIIFGEEGILEKAKQAKEMQANAQAEEKEILADTANYIDGYIVGEKNLEGYIKIPTETLDIKANGKYDVTNYAEVNVNIPILGEALTETITLPTDKQTYEHDFGFIPSLIYFKSINYRPDMSFISYDSGNSFWQFITTDGTTTAVANTTLSISDTKLIFNWANKDWNGSQIILYAVK